MAEKLRILQSANWPESQVAQITHSDQENKFCINWPSFMRLTSPIALSPSSPPSLQHHHRHYHHHHHHHHPQFLITVIAAPIYVIMEFVAKGKLQEFLRKSRAEHYYGNLYGKSWFAFSRLQISVGLTEIFLVSGDDLNLVDFYRTLQQS